MDCNEISNTCADTTLSTCVDFEGTLGENTKITTDCVNQSDVNIDLYAITDEIVAGSAISDKTSTCITIPIGATVKEVQELYEDKICEMNNQITVLQNFNYSTLDITGFGLDFNCLVDPCGDPITNLGQLLQIMINKDCE